VTQLALFDQPTDRDASIPSPICCYDRCARHGRAVLGAPVDHGDCINRRVRCVTCARTGVQSTRTDL
jgi:hypothetical protein